MRVTDNLESPPATCWVMNGLQGWRKRKRDGRVFEWHCLVPTQIVIRPGGSFYKLPSESPLNFSVSLWRLNNTLCCSLILEFGGRGRRTGELNDSFAILGVIFRWKRYWISYSLSFVSLQREVCTKSSACKLNRFNKQLLCNSPITPQWYHPLTPWKYQMHWH